MNAPLHAVHHTLRMATYNIHKGVRGIGPCKRLEIHNLGHAVEQFDADIICLQEVHKRHRRRALAFKRPAKKSELLRAGLQALSALSDTQFKAALEALTLLKPGRPKQGE